MARFYAEVQGARGAVSRLGHGVMNTTTKSWQGEINVRMWARPDGSDHVTVTAEDHGGGNPRVLYDGEVGGWKELGPLGWMAIAASTLR